MNVIAEFLGVADLGHPELGGAVEAVAAAVRRIRDQFAVDGPVLAKEHFPIRPVDLKHGMPQAQLGLVEGGVNGIGRLSHGLTIEVNFDEAGHLAAPHFRSFDGEVEPGGVGVHHETAVVGVEDVIPGRKI